MAEKKKSVIKKKISRDINIGRFHQLEITCEFEEEVEWGDIKERQEKSEKITNLLIVDFMRTLSRVMDELQVDRKVAFVKNTSGGS